MAKSKHTTDIDLGSNRLSNAGFEVLSTPPAPAFESQMYYNTVTKRMYYYNGTEWIDIGVLTIAPTVFTTTVSAGGNGSYTVTHNLSGVVDTTVMVKSTGEEVVIDVKYVDANSILIKSNLPLTVDYVVTCVYTGVYPT